MTVHPNSLANLTPWPKGHSGNRNGRPNSGGSLLEHLDELAAEDAEGNAVYEVQVLRDITVDQRSSHTRAMAAEWIILGRTPGFHEKSGKPYCAMLIEMLLDRKIGKPAQTIHVTKTTLRPPAVIGVDKAPLVLQCFASIPPSERPALLAQMMALDPPVIDAEPIDPA